MSARPAIRAIAAPAGVRAGATAAAALLTALALAVALRAFPPPSPPLVLAGALAGLAVALLAVTRYEAAVTFGLVLLAVVRFQPAPTDAVLALVIVVAVSTGRFQAARAPSVVTALIGAFLALTVISTGNSVSFGVAVSFLAITAYLAVFALWLTSHVDGRVHARQVVIGYLLAALLSAALGVLAIVAPIPGRSSLLLDSRAMALFKDPNVFGPFLIPALLILLEETVTPRLLRVRRALKLAGVVLLAVGILFSYSRGAWLNLSVGLLVMTIVVVIRRRSARPAARLLALLSLAIVGAIAALVLSGSVNFLIERAHLQTYDTSRFSAQSAGISLGEHHPLGIGPGQFDVVEPLSSHNLYVRVFAEQGPLGLLALAALVLATLAFAARAAVRGRDTYGIGSAALLGAWCGLLANSTVIDTLHWRHLWLVAALIWAGAVRRPAPVARSAPPEPPTLGAPIIRLRRTRARP